MIRDLKRVQRKERAAMYRRHREERMAVPMSVVGAVHRRQMEEQTELRAWHEIQRDVTRSHWYAVNYRASVDMD